jgi:Flp pilus assembly protein TadG
MAGFTSMALLGAGLLGGAVGGSLLNRRRQGQQNQPQLAPGPTDANANTAAPQPPIVNPGDANAQALGAATKQRRRTAQGSLLTNPVAPTSNTMRPGTRYATRSLLGS